MFFQFKTIWIHHYPVFIWIYFKGELWMILLFWSLTAPKCTSDSRQGPHLNKVFKKMGPSSTPSFLVGWLQRSVLLSQICLIKDVSFFAKHWSDLALQNGNVWILNQRNIKYCGTSHKIEHTLLSSKTCSKPFECSVSGYRSIETVALLYEFLGLPVTDSCSIKRRYCSNWNLL